MDEELDELGTVEYLDIVPEDSSETISNIEILEQSVQTEEEIQSVQVEGTQEIEVETTEAVGWVGGDTARHYSLNGRDEYDQHPIKAITGLRSELDEIERLKTVQSDSVNIANYYEWHDALYDTYGYFVSIVPNTSTIKICDGVDIFGVSVDAAGFVGGQDANDSRKNTHGLIVTSGLVDVRCELDVEVGDYVTSNKSGYATKTSSNYGYRVFARENKNGIEYAVIMLGVQACTTDVMGKNLQQIADRVDSAEINIAAAINVAQAAYNKAEESISSNSSMSDQVQDALSRVDEITADVGNMNTQVENIATISAQAKAIAESAVTSAESARTEAVNQANAALARANEIEQTVEPISRWSYTDPVTGETNTGAEYFAEYVKNGLSTKAEMETVSTLDEENKLLIAKNAEEYSRMLSSVDKYSVGEFSQAYGLTLDQAKTILKTGMIYIPTGNTHTETYTDVTYEFTPGFYYIWNGETWDESIGKVWFGTTQPAGTAYAYWYDEAELYILDGDTWIKVATLAGNVNNRITSMVRQFADGIYTEIVNARGSGITLSDRLSNTDATIANNAFWKNDDGSEYVATFQQQAGGDGSSLTLVAKRTDTTNGTEQDQSVELEGASIVLGQNDSSSYITIDAKNIILDGNVAFTTTENGSTKINGANIATGSITADQIDATGLTATEVDISGKLTATTGYIGSQTNGWTINDDSIYYGTSFSSANAFLCTGSKTSFTIAGHTSTGWVLKAGSNFGVNTKGELYCRSAHITGTISASSTFAGSLSAATGTFAGSLSAATGTFGNTTYPFHISSGSDSANSPCIYSRGSSFAGSGGLGIIADNYVYIGGDGFSYWGGNPSTFDYNTAIRPSIVFCSGDNNGNQEQNTAVAYTNYGITFYYGGTTNLRTINANNYQIVKMSVRSNDLYISGTITGNTSGSIISDKNKKNSISTFSDKYNVLYDALVPVTYKFNYGTSNRIHSGFIAQDVLQAINNAGLTTQDFAAYVETKDENDEETCSLRYEEFIALNTWQIQKLKKRVQELEDIVAKLQ